MLYSTLPLWLLWKFCRVVGQLPRPHAPGECSTEPMAAGGSEEASAAVEGAGSAVGLAPWGQDAGEWGVGEKLLS